MLQAHLRRAIVLALILIASTPPLGRALAQGGNDGSIIGYVFDQTGAPLAGVKITASSPTQIGGAKTGLHQRRGAVPAAAAVPRNLPGARPRRPS